MADTRNLWSEKEDNILRSEFTKQAAQGHVRDWCVIAAKLPGRSNKDCRKRWLKLEESNKGPWSEEENQRLREAVQKQSVTAADCLSLQIRWTEVARLVGTRGADQCAKRWLHFLDPQLDHSEWTEEEDRHLLATVERTGRNWRKIVNEMLVSRSATDAKNRYSILQRSMAKSTAGSRKRSSPGSEPGEEEQTGMTIDQWIAKSRDLTDRTLTRSAARNSDIAVPQSNMSISFAPPSDSATAHLQQQDITMMPFPDWITQEPSPNSPHQSLSDISGFASSSSAGVALGGDSAGHFPSANAYAAIAYPGTDASVELEASVYSNDMSSVRRIHTTTALHEKVCEEDEAYQTVNHGQISPENSESSSAACTEKSGSSHSRKTTMIVQDMPPELVGEVLSVLLKSTSSVNVKIMSQDQDRNENQN